MPALRIHRRSREQGRSLTRCWPIMLSSKGRGSLLAASFEVKRCVMKYGFAAAVLPEAGQAGHTPGSIIAPVSGHVKSKVTAQPENSPIIAHICLSEWVNHFFATQLAKNYFRFCTGFLMRFCRSGLYRPHCCPLRSNALAALLAVLSA